MSRATITRKVNVYDASALPAWVPAPGTFANISLNTMQAAQPTGWPNSDIGSPFGNWSGGFAAPDFGAGGGYGTHGSGHLSAGAPLYAGAWIFDIASRMWVGRNVPAQPLTEGGAMNGYAEFTDAAVAGHTYPPHTYDGLVYQSLANGGGAVGSMIRHCFAGAGISGAKAVHRFDLSQTSAPPTRVIDDSGTSTSYPMTALDEARGGYWALNANGTGPLVFVKFSDWSKTEFAGKGYNEYGDNSLVYIPAPWDCLVGMGRNNSVLSAGFAVRVCPIVGGVPQGFTQVTPTGTRPTDSRCGGCWSTILECIVSYVAAGSTAVHKLTPPAPGNLTSGTWAWASETLTGASGATPSRCPANDNGAWSRFIEFPRYRCFLWADSMSQPVQAWRLAGM